jgi:rhamnogalacturonyl hydrolase YesR
VQFRTWNHYPRLIVPATSTTGQELPVKATVVATMQSVNDYWIKSHVNPGNRRWARAVYFTGNMALYAVYPRKTYLDYAMFWADKNKWAAGVFSRNPDGHCCGQTYIDLFGYMPIASRISNIKRTIDKTVNSTKRSDWFWIDALYMAMPVFARLGVVYNDRHYFSAMHELYRDTKIRRKLYDAYEGLWFRDRNYVAPHATPNGKKIFWARGNGWVFAAHVRVLSILPLDDPHRTEYCATFTGMAAALKKVQRNDGFWDVSLADSAHYPGPETSATALFTYGLAWGINNGLLDSAAYYQVVVNAWNGLVTTAVRSDGFLGYVQGAGVQPASSQPVTAQSTADFGVGAFLLAGSEVCKLAPGDLPIPGA